MTDRQDMEALADRLDQIETDAAGKCHWSDVATVSDVLRHAARAVGAVAEDKPPFHFDRYVSGTLKAEGVCIERQTTLAGAMREAARLAEKGPNGEAPVLIYRSVLRTRPAADREEVAREALNLLMLIEEECLDLRCHNIPTGGDDYDVGWQVIEHHMAKPHERVIGLGSSAIEALRQVARTRPVYYARAKHEAERLSLRATTAGDEIEHFRTFDTRGTKLTRCCNVFTVTCEDGDIAKKIASQLRTVPKSASSCLGTLPSGECGPSVTTPAGEANAPVAWLYEYNDIHDYWRPGIVLNTPVVKNPPTSHHGKPVRNVRAVYTHPAPSDSAIREALAALKPFAEAAADYDEIPGVRLTHGDVEVWQQSNRAGYRLTVDHLRNARSAVAALSLHPPAEKEG